MTEYDYSPAAYERYMDKQRTVSNWVSQTTQHAPLFGNPFVPSARVTDSPRTSPTHQPSRRPSYSTTSTTRPRNYHHDAHASPSRHSSSRSRSYSVDHSSSRSHSSSRPHHSRSHTYHAYDPVPPPQPRGYYSTPVRSNTVPVTYPSRQHVVLPPPQPGQQYYIIPPPGRRVEVISPPTSPSRKSQPLLKRLFTSFGPRISWSSDGGSSKGSSHLSRRTHRRPTY